METKTLSFSTIKAEHRRKTNLISKLRDESRYWWRGESNVERLMVSYFSNILSSSMPKRIEEACVVVQGKLTADYVN